MAKMRTVTHRKPRYNKPMSNLGQWLLQTAEQILWKVAGLDTAVRDNVSTGLTYIVQAGNDCTASNLDLTTDQWMSFIDNATADWFRARGYAEWFCIAAACGFSKRRPRTLDEGIFRIRKVRPSKRKS